MDLISVIVAVYNVEKYLDRCIRSLINQTYKNLEILLIDDGSLDSSSQICDEWALRDRRIRVIHKENQGAGMARNTGIENAMGSYVCFFDSDDYIDPELIQKAYTKIQREQAEVVVYGCILTWPEEKRYIPLPPQPSREVYQGDAVISQFLPEYLGDDPVTGIHHRIPKGAWSAMYCMDLIKRTNWHFVSERDLISEDIYSLLVLYKDVRKLAVLKEALYYYCQNPASLTHIYREDRQKKVNNQYHKSVELCRELGYPEQVVRRCMEPAVAATMEILKQETAAAQNRKEALSRVRRVLADNTLQYILQAKRKDKTNPKRWLFLWTMRNQFCGLCYALIMLQRYF